jgi:deoxyribodipyrimidine photo-lyase
MKRPPRLDRKESMRALHWFRNDLRLRDNPALHDASRAEDGLAALVVLDEKLLDSIGSEAPRTRYWLACLQSLAKSLAERDVPLIVVTGDPTERVPEIARRHRIDLVSWNADYTPYAASRDDAVQHALEAEGRSVRVRKGRVIFESREVRTGTGGSYAVFTPYARNWRERLGAGGPDLLRVPRLRGLADVGADGLRKTDAITSVAALEAPSPNEDAALRRLDAFVEHRMARYHEDRDRPAVDGTSRLSAALRFGLLSPAQCVRRALDAADDDPRRRAGAEKWIGELIWRDFYAGILSEHPIAARTALKPAFRGVRWNEDPDAFAAWREGRTGYPIVDAGMRQLAATGWMHNRVRMIVASFLVKDLLIDWRQGEAHFMASLVDGDPASNNGGWQWAASTGSDAVPYFRIFNPTAQGERFDPDGDYVRRFVPELAGLPGRSAHRPWESPLAAAGYARRIVDHAEQRKIALARYREALGPVD